MEVVLRNPGPVPLRSITGRRSHEVRVGIFVIASVIAALAVLFTGANLSLRHRTHLTTLVPDAAGLRVGDGVRMRGVDVGTVRAFRFTPDGVEITLEVNDRYPVPADSRVVISPKGLLGGVRANIEPGRSSDAVSDASALPGSTDLGVSGSVAEITQRASQTLDRANQLLSSETIQGVRTSSAQLAATLSEIHGMVAQERQDVVVLLRSLRRSAQGIERATGGQKLEELTARLDLVAARLATSADSAQAILGRVEQGHGSLGRLTRDDSLYVNANEAAVNIGHAASQLSELVRDVRENPRKYVKVSLF